MPYAGIPDLYNVGLAPPAVGNLTPTQLGAQLQAASDFADTFFRARYGAANVPFATWDTSVTLNVARIAAFYAITVRGMRAGGEDWTLFRTIYQDGVDWLNKVQRQQAHPTVTFPGGGNQPPFQPNLVSSSVVSIATGRTGPRRGW